MIIHVKAGIDSEKSSKGIFTIGSIISRPTMISAGAVAAAGIERKSGEKKRATAKQMAMTKAVRPERPPCATPAALSTYVVVVFHSQQPFPVPEPQTVRDALCLR